MDDFRIESTIGERIKRFRIAALMTQDDLAAAAGVSTDLIRKLEQGRRHTASITSLHRIARALDVDLRELPLASHCRRLTGRACAHANLALEEQALMLLLAAEGMSPDWIRHQSLARAVTRDLLTAERRVNR
ncbi:MAG: helix-turn-helix domain-containing protein [Pseudonocardiaceae bacterium]